MSTVIDRAKSTNRPAMTRLYDASVAKVYALTRLVVGEKAASTILVNTYKAIWDTLGNTSLHSEADFEQYALSCALTQCRRYLHGKDTKSFRLPSDRQFILRDTAALATDAASADELVAVLPPLHRALLVGRAFGIEDDTLRSIFKLDAHMLVAAVAAESHNVNALLSNAPNSTVGSYKELIDKLTAATYTVPSETELLITDHIKALAAPIEKKQRKKTWTVLGVVIGSCVIILALCAAVLWDMTRPEADTTEDPYASESETVESNAPATDVAFSTDYTATHVAEIDIADYGKITLELDANMAPETVANFKSLADSGFYDGLTFHRIMEDFMMQGGDPEGTGMGGADTNLKGEFAENGVENTLTHTRGAISMARSTDYNSASSQFFIVHEDSTFLDGQYAAFGYVTDGMDVVDAVCTDAEPTDDNGSIPHEAQPIINTVTVTAIG